MLGMLTLLAASTASTTTVPAVPREFNAIILFQNFIQKKYWWLRSPRTDTGIGAYYPLPVGTVGSLSGNYGNTIFNYSYGSISPDLTYPDAYYIDRGGDTYSRYYVTGSYGKQISPSTSIIGDYAFFVDSSGNVNYGGYVGVGSVRSSYG